MLNTRITFTPSISPAHKPVNFGANRDKPANHAAKNVYGFPNDNETGLSKHFREEDQFRQETEKDPNQAVWEHARTNPKFMEFLMGHIQAKQIAAAQQRWGTPNK